MKRTSPEKELEIINIYLQTFSTEKTAIQANVAMSTVYSSLSRNNVPLKSISYQRDKYKNSDCFTDFTREKDSYFYGFILADGNLTPLEGKVRRIQIELQKRDEHILQEFKNYLASENKITASFRSASGVIKEYSSFSINSSTLYNRLLDLNMSPRKSCNEKLPSFDWQNNRHFWRGVVDGDGSLFFTQGIPCVKLIGSSEVVNGFNEFCWKHCFTKRRTVEKDKRSSGVFTLCFNGEEALQIAEVLYNDCEVKLERKHNKALEFIEYFKTYKKGIKKGVSLTKKYNTYKSAIKVNGISIYLGSFKTYREALLARINAEVLYYDKNFEEIKWYSHLYQQLN